MNDSIPAWVLAALEEAVKSGIYGRLTIIFENGSAVRIQVETSKLPPKPAAEQRKGLASV